LEGGSDGSAFWVRSDEHPNSPPAKQKEKIAHTANKTRLKITFFP
jgi:hypothetical protein